MSCFVLTITGGSVTSTRCDTCGHFEHDQSSCGCVHVRNMQLVRWMLGHGTSTANSSATACCSSAAAAAAADS
jgi:hypothetical protein